MSDNNKNQRQGGGQWVVFAVTGTARWSGSLKSTLIVCSQESQRHKTPEIRLTYYCRSLSKQPRLHLEMKRLVVQWVTAGAF